MYLVPIVVPIYVSGDQLFVTTEWKRSLVLLRDSLQGRYGDIAVVAPRGDWDPRAREQDVERVRPESEGIQLHPSIPAECRARDYWMRFRRQWIDDNLALLDRADVVHSALDDLYRPRMYDAWKLAVRRGLPTVFVQDTDAVLQIRELTAGGSALQRLKWSVYCGLYERMCRRGVKRSSLSLLKGETLMRRYARFGRRVREFHDTSYTSNEIVPLDTVRERTASLKSTRPLRLVYCGRLIERKGVVEGIRMVAEARKLGARIELDIIGDGPQRDQVRALIESLDVRNGVRMLGSLAYGGGLIKQLATYDALFFTPLGEDTPRMIFDGYAAGLPLVATTIEYVRERAAADKATVGLPRNDVPAAARVLVEIDGKRDELSALAVRAHEAGKFHAA
ncbi:MAG TPA: glycosyltransferase, partial [Planctomycetota bacterium]|nr:glycosyltransferase [Planctomycetota bacterium]